MTDLVQRLNRWYEDGGSLTAREAAECIKALRKEHDIAWKNVHILERERQKQDKRPADLQSAWEKFRLTATDNFTSFVAGWLACKDATAKQHNPHEADDKDRSPR